MDGPAGCRLWGAASPGAAIDLLSWMTANPLLVPGEALATVAAPGGTPRLDAGTGGVRWPALGYGSPGANGTDAFRS